MSTFCATYTITRTRTIIETATVVATIEADNYGDAGDEAEDLTPSFEDASFEVLSEDSEEGPSFLSSIARQPDPIVAKAAPSDDLSGLTPALYAGSPQPSGGTYYPVQVEPTPDIG